MPTRVWPTRAEQSSDRAAVRAINLAAFDTAEEADLVDALRQDPAWIEGLSRVATDERDQPVGHALLTRARIGEVAALCLAPCAVLPGYQRKGAGSAVISAALEAGHRIRHQSEALMVLSLDESRTPPGGLVRYAVPFGI